MKIKILSGVIVLAVSSTFGGMAQSATESTQTTIEKSTTVDVGKPVANVREEHSTTTTKKGILGRKKTETSTSSSSRVERDPEVVTNSSVRSRTTVETERKQY